MISYGFILLLILKNNIDAEVLLKRSMARRAVVAASQNVQWHVEQWLAASYYVQWHVEQWLAASYYVQWYVEQWLAASYFVQWYVEPW